MNLTVEEWYRALEDEEKSNISIYQIRKFLYFNSLGMTKTQIET